MERIMPNKVAVGMGIMEFPFSGAAAYWRWVDMLEAGGVDSLWQTDRLVSPTPFLECMSVMAALAGRTRRLKFGVNVLSLAMRDAVLVARQCATIDFLSDGRLLPAFGIGSSRPSERKSMVAHCRATSTASRIASDSTLTPNFKRRVRPASAAITLMHSRNGVGLTRRSVCHSESTPPASSMSTQRQ